MIDVSKLSEHDRLLVEKAMAVTNPINWWDVPKEEEAESREAKEFLHRRATYLYHREEGAYI